MILNPQQENKVIDTLSRLSHPVILRVYSNTPDDSSTLATMDLVHYTASLAPATISGQLLPIDDTSLHDPTLTIGNPQGRILGVQFVGTPSGLEYQVLIDAIVAFAQAELIPQDPLLREIRHPVAVKIFVAPT